jgi:ribosome biogenesis GTPase
MNTLETFGWTNFFADQLDDYQLPDRTIGRVVADYGGYLKVVTPKEQLAEVAGKLKFTQASHDLPKVGDWVLMQLNGDDRATIHNVLARKSEISRKASGGKTGKQILAANIDVAFIVQALDGDFNIARLERYVYQLRQAAIDPIFIFNKADLAHDLTTQLNQVEQLAVPYLVTNAITGEGLQQLRNKILPQQTAVFLGSSGVGKSTLTNLLLGEERQKTGERREDDARGRHTTSYRELFILPGGGLIIDTPGIRELQLWGEEELLLSSFADIAELASNCEFRNCSHTKERYCAVLAAIKNGTLAVSRLESYQKMKQELQTTSEQISISNIKAQKQRARRMRKTVADQEKLDEDGSLY